MIKQTDNMTYRKKDQHKKDKKLDDQTNRQKDKQKNDEHKKDKQRDDQTGT